MLKSLHREGVLRERWLNDFVEGEKQRWPTGCGEGAIELKDMIGLQISANASCHSWDTPSAYSALRLL